MALERHDRTDDDTARPNILGGEIDVGRVASIVSRVLIVVMESQGFPSTSLAFGMAEAVFLSTQAILAWAKSQRIVGLGRWGEWSFFNSDICVQRALSLAESFCRKCKEAY